MVNVAHLESQRFIDENGWESVGFQVINEKPLFHQISIIRIGCLGVASRNCWEIWQAAIFEDAFPMEHGYVSSAMLVFQRIFSQI